MGEILKIKTICIVFFFRKPAELGRGSGKLGHLGDGGSRVWVVHPVPPTGDLGLMVLLEGM